MGQLDVAQAGTGWLAGTGPWTGLGRATVAAYALAFVLCLLARRTARRTPTRPTATFWLVLAALMLALGLNRLLDLPGWAGQVSRHLTLGQGYYEGRRFYQATLIAVVGVLGLIALAVLTWRAARSRWPVVPLVGATSLVTYLLIRTVSLHQVDQFIARSVLGVRLNAIIELGGIATVALGAVRALRRPEPQTRVVPPPAPSLLERVARHR